jgi:hypothetical protein
MPNIPVAIYTDSIRDIIDFDFSIIGQHNQEKVFLSKIKACQNTPFNKTIFIDVDSRVLRTVHSLYDILDFHDFGLCFADGRGILKSDEWSPNLTGLPLSSSTLVFKKNKKVDHLLTLWEKEYIEGMRFPNKGDQVYLKYLLYHQQGLRYFILPNEFRCNTDNPQFVGGSVKIITSLTSDIDRKGKIKRSYLDKLFNSILGRRLIEIKRFLKFKKRTWNYLTKGWYFHNKF